MKTILKKQIFPDGKYDAELISVEKVKSDGSEKIKVDYLIEEPKDQRNKIYSHYISINEKSKAFLQVYCRLIMPEIEFNEQNIVENLSDKIGMKLIFNLFNKNGFQNCAIIKASEE